MTFVDAKKHAKEGRKIRRENWPHDFYVEVSAGNENKRLSFQDSCGRDYGLSNADEQANDWELFE